MKTERHEPNLEALEQSLSVVPKMPEAKSFAPPTQRGIHELIAEVEEALELVNQRVDNIKRRLAEFDRLQASFYQGQKP